MASIEVQGEVFFPPVIKPITVKQLVVSLRDISALDGPAKTLTTMIIPDVQLRPNHQSHVPFRLTVEVPSGQAVCAIRAHADVLATGRVDVGDFVTDSTVLIDPFNVEPMYRIDVRTIGGNT
jgi:uncharacterized lipoprotein YbaY